MGDSAWQRGTAVRPPPRLVDFLPAIADFSAAIDRCGAAGGDRELLATAQLNRGEVRYRLGHFDEAEVRAWVNCRYSRANCSYRG
jgi:hypothetical protein